MHSSFYLKFQTLTLLIVIFSSMVGTGPVFAASLIVTTTVDEDNSGADCSLREAITAANTDAPYGGCTADALTNNITIPAGIYTLVSQQLPAITSPITLNGNSAADTIIQANESVNSASYRIFEVDNTGNLVLDHLTIQNGHCNGSCATANQSDGGGIYNAGSLSITNSILANNSALTNGGGIYNASQGSLTLQNSTFTGNSSNSGGGLFIVDATAAAITNSTFSGNAATSNGGGVYNAGNLTVLNVTFSGNSAATHGGGIYNFNHGTITLENTILSNTLNSADDCANEGDTINGGNNLIETDAAAFPCGTASSINIIDPDLGPLAVESGTTPTFALLPGSAAINTGNESVCAAVPVNGASQNNVSRPQGSRCDIGAYEFTGSHFAFLGDFGYAGQPELDVSNLIKGWNVDFIATLGDNNYDSGSAATIDQNIGQYYHEYIKSYAGTYGAGSITDRFYPALGNHDWVAVNAQPYLEYFALPGNERYYDYISGPIHFFVIDSDPNEPDGIDSLSTQATWLKAGLLASTSEWNLVYFHHSPFSSGLHGSTTIMQWPFASWGADAVITGHDHTFERIMQNGIPYFVNGLGGRFLYTFGTPIAGSQFRYNADYGAMLVDANETSINFKMISRTNALIDEYSLTSAPPSVVSITRETSNPVNTSTIRFTVTFSEAVTGVDANSFALTTSGGLTAAITNVSGTGTLRTITIQTGAGSGTIRLDLPASSGIMDLKRNQLNNLPYTNGEVVNIQSLTFTSNPVQDGQIRESSETSGTGGDINTNASLLNLGDGAANQQYRGILSFDTTSLPDTAVITSASLKFKYAGKAGTLPFITHGNLVVDIRKGYFSIDPTLQAGDFNASSSKNSVLSFNSTTLSNWYIKSIAAVHFKFINLTNATQFRLRFQIDDNNDFGADLLKIYSGNSSAANRPQLVIEYVIP